MKNNDTITFEEVDEILRYDPDSGKLFWKVAKQGRQLSKEAGWLHKISGYRYIGINYILYAAHRLAYLLYYKKWPSDQIDHINHDRSDNRISNLRNVTHQENGQNQKKRIDNKYGITGIYWCNDINKWRASITVNYKQIHLGCFTNKEDAIDARKQAEVKYGYHPSHGK